MAKTEGKKYKKQNKKTVKNRNNFRPVSEKTKFPIHFCLFIMLNIVATSLNSIYPISSYSTKFICNIENAHYKIICRPIFSTKIPFVHQISF